MLKVFVRQGLGVAIFPLFALTDGKRPQPGMSVVGFADGLLNASCLAVCCHRHRPLGAATGRMRGFLEQAFSEFFVAETGTPAG